MLDRPQPLRPPSRETRARRFARWAAGRRTPLGRARLAAGRLDQRLLILLRTRGHSAVSDRFVQGLGLFGEMGSGWAAIGVGGAVAEPAERKRWLAAATVAPVAIVFNYAIKVAIGRERPLIEDHPPLAAAPSKLSFPSAHSTSAMAAATALSRVHPSSRPALYTLAAAICIGRPYLGMHYPSDVLAGAALGTALGRVYPLPAPAVRR